MKTYQCHKRVQAARITEIGVSAKFKDIHVLTIEGGTAVMCDAAWIEKHKPEEGGYLVVYADGYRSYSPAAVFEDGYSPIPE